LSAMGRYVTFQMAEVAVSRQMFNEIPSLIARVQIANLANIAVYVVTRIVLVPLSGQASGEFRLNETDIG